MFSFWRQNKSTSFTCFQQQLPACSYPCFVTRHADVVCAVSFSSVVLWTTNENLDCKHNFKQKIDGRNGPFNIFFSNSWTGPPGQLKNKPRPFFSFLRICCFRPKENHDMRFHTIWINQEISSFGAFCAEMLIEINCNCLSQTNAEFCKAIPVS